MTVEAINYITDFVTSNPPNTDNVSEACLHLNGIKLGTKNSFPNINAPVNATPTEMNLLVGRTGALRSTGVPTQGEWKLLANVAITGVAAVDLVHGSGGVVIDTNYDLYQVDIEGIGPSGSITDIRLALSSNGGSTWTLIGTLEPAQASLIDTGTASASQISGGNYFPVTGGQTLAAAGGAANSASGSVLIKQIVDASTVACLFSEVAHSGGTKVARVAMRSSFGTAFNGIRLFLGAGSFQAIGRLRLWGRRFV